MNYNEVKKIWNKVKNIEDYNPLIYIVIYDWLCSNNYIARINLDKLNSSDTYIYCYDKVLNYFEKNKN